MDGAAKEGVRARFSTRVIGCSSRHERHCAPPAGVLFRVGVAVSSIALDFVRAVRLQHTSDCLEQFQLSHLQAAMLRD